eukprot:CCRYP_018386-RA/>CCRYP_018386-RA protein AED:0.38 eAED:0.45 QI:0/-1/0/1/-1/0/1/0/226
MYLQTPMDRYEYIRIPADLVPDEFKNAYNLWDKIHNGYIYMEIRRRCYRLPQTGILANKLLKKRLAEEGYFELPHAPGLFRHTNRPIQFSVVVDDFGIKYQGKQHLKHLIQTIRHHYEVTVNELGSLYCVITLEWHYEQGYINISMPGYVNKQLIKYNHPPPKKNVNTQWEPCAVHYGAKTQHSLSVDNPLCAAPRQTQNSPHSTNRQILFINLLHNRSNDPACAQ